MEDHEELQGKEPQAEKLRGKVLRGKVLRGKALRGKDPHARARISRHRGTTLVELMVALVIAAVVIAGSLSLYAHTRSNSRANERIARLQEQGRFALSMIEPDIELAGFYGFTNAPETVRLVRTTGAPGAGGASNASASARAVMVVATANDLRQFSARGDRPPHATPWLPAGAHACGVNFAVDVSMPVQGANDRFQLGRHRTGACGPYRGRARAGADTLTLRRAATETNAAEAGRIQVYASRLSSRTTQLLFADGRSPGAADADHHVHDLLVRTYYIAQDSVGRRGWPALRVKFLTRSGAGASFDDEEVMPGVEDLQVQFAIAPGDGRVTRYVNPDYEGVPDLQVMAVRLWLRVRSDEREPELQDTRTYRYANVAYTPEGAERNYRRVVMSRTVAVRNARLM